MLELNTEEISKFKQSIDSLAESMAKLKINSVVSLKVSLPNDKAFKNLSVLKTLAKSFDASGFNDLGTALKSIGDVKYSGISNLIKDFDTLSSMNVNSAIGNLRDVEVAYKRFSSILGVNKPIETKELKEVIPKQKGVFDFFKKDKLSVEPTLQKEGVKNTEKPKVEETQSRNKALDSVTSFIRVSSNSDRGSVHKMINTLKRVGEIKVDPVTADFFEFAGKMGGKKITLGSIAPKEEVGTQAKAKWSDLFRKDNKSADIVSVVATSLAVLGSGVFLKRQANIAKEVTDLLSLSEITGLDSFSNRAGISALGGNPSNVADQQRRASRELINAKLFGEIDPKRLILHNILGTNFGSSQEEIIKKSQKLDPKMRDFVLSTLHGDEFAKMSSRYDIATRGATKEQRTALDKVVFTDAPDIDIGSYTRFMVHFEGFFSLSKVLFQKILGPSITVLENSFQRINMSILKLTKNEKATATLGRVISAFVTSFASTIEFFVDGFVKVGKFIVDNNLESTFVSAASVLGVLVGGGLILKVIGLTTSVLLSLIGFGKIKTLAALATQSLSGIFLPTTVAGGTGGNKGGVSKTPLKTPTVVGNLARGGAGVITVLLATESINSLSKLWGVTPEGKTESEYNKEKWGEMLKTTGLGLGVVAGFNWWNPAGWIAGALGATSYGAGYAIQNTDEIVNVLSEMLGVLTNQNQKLDIKNNLNVSVTVPKDPVDNNIVRSINYHKNQ